ncbi:diguanylate cyclase [Neobacillus pocheonensis]|uniref:diguanylate cyclase domain-containing protein n=1 Tax=Neobacillus pocheonensis TaxID=363869 RepID=UPI003D2D52EC
MNTSWGMAVLDRTANFKAVNDSLGHEIGDKLLIEIAERLIGLTNKKDIISRYGGDEFTILLSDSTDKRANEVAQSILASLPEPFSLNHHEIIVTPSIGISIFPDHGDNFDTLIKKADLAMYFAKSLGKNNFQFFHCDLMKKFDYELDLEIKLRKALGRNEFVLYFQPQIDMETNEIIGAEALIRWEHPKKGIVSPIDFIPGSRPDSVKAF